MKFNIKLWGLTCLLMILCINISFATSYFNYTTDAHGLSWQSSGSGSSTAECSQIYSKIDGLLINVTTQSDTTYTRARVFNQSRVLINTASISSNYAFLNNSIKANNTYYICFDSSGAGYTSKYQTVVSFPYVKRNINFNYTYLYDGATWTPDPNMRDIVSISTAILNQTTSPLNIVTQIINTAYWNTPTINLTWNVTNAQNGTITIYRNGITNQTLFYQPIGYNITGINNNFLIADNISYNLYLQNSTYNLTQNSSIIQILPPLTNYVNILNTSSIWKQNLSANYSETNKNESIYYWRINNSIVKYSSDFNISDYTNAYLGKNITFCINSTVPSQNYNLENCSSNSFIIGQIINLTSTTTHNGSAVSGFNITFSLGSFETTSNYLTIYNYNITDTYIFTKSGIITQSVNLTTNITNQSYNFVVYYDNTIYLIFLDEITSAPISNVSFDIISTVYSGRFTSNNSIYTIFNVPPADYEIRYAIQNSSGTTSYKARSYFFRIPIVDQTNANVTLRMINSSLSTIFSRNIKDENSLPLENAILEIQRYYSDSGVWKTVEMSNIDSQGNAVFNVVANTQAYRFRILQNFTLIQTLSPSYLVDSSSEIIAETGTDRVETFKNCRDIQASISNGSNYIYVDYLDSSSTITNFCLYVTRNYRFYSYANSSCSTDKSGTIVIMINKSLPGTVTAQAYATIDGESCLTDSETFEEFEADKSSGKDAFGVVGWILVALCVAVVGVLTYFEPILGILCLVLVLAGFGLKFLGIVAFAGILVGGIVFVGVIYLWLRQK